MAAVYTESSCFTVQQSFLRIALADLVAPGNTNSFLKVSAISVQDPL